MTDLILNQAETVIKKAGGREYLSLGRMSAWLTLTSQRLIVQTVLGATSDYPLSHITGANLHAYQPPLAWIVLFPVKLLRVDFDNGGSILFGLSDIPAWIQAIEQARAVAPALPYTTPPVSIPQSDGRAASPGVWIGVAILATGIFCVGGLSLAALLLFLTSR